ncbi:hypothetical protein QBC44DRAFT_40624 [Cladorrhinum sp. PSN332]|nr:hypothetical protein QBC44DRAFT_40624 [Cladorrhinum sp. PSN332]
MHIPNIALLLLPIITSASPLSRRSVCSETSFKHFNWTVKSFDFHANYIFSTPAHQNSWGYSSFDLFNPADLSTVSCSAASSQLNDFFYGTIPYTCNDTATGRHGATKFDFNRPTGELRANQTWTCDLDQQYPITFTGYGAVNLTLDCDQTFYQNPNWTIGEIYSRRDITCQKVDTVMEPYQMEAIA